MMKRNLCVFLKHPEPGRVKTRLAESLGDSEAAEIYRRLVCEVFLQARLANPDSISVFYAPADKAESIKAWLSPWLKDFPGEVNFYAQSDGDLGDRLKAATTQIFDTESDVGSIIIGTDCIELTPDLLETTWETLENNQAPVVIGPSTDGGYYLIATREPILSLYDEVPWSTELVLGKTMENAAAGHKECFLLPEKTDIDTINEYRLFEERLKQKPCVFYDRDGVVNQSPGPGYVLKKEDFHLSEGITESLQVARSLGYFTIVVTSQKGVGKKLMTENDLNDIHYNLQTGLAESRAAFDGIYSYTGTPECAYEAKPHPAMITAAAKDFPIDLSRSWIIGDADRDIEMGLNAKLGGTIRIRGDKPITIEASHTVDSVSELPKLLRKLL